MSDLVEDARLFCSGVGSRYFAEVCDALREELAARGDAQQLVALEALRRRLLQMRDLLETRLRDATVADTADTDGGGLFKHV